MSRKLQAVKLRFNDGEEHVFIGPAILSEGEDTYGIESIDFSNQLEYDSTLSLEDLWLMVQQPNAIH